MNFFVKILPLPLPHETAAQVSLVLLLPNCGKDIHDFAQVGQGKIFMIRIILPLGIL